jgi:uncharacterized repeat protein (TIGR02543 family)
MKIKTILIVILFLLFLGGCQINEEYTVHFDSQGGTPISSITIFEDGTLALPNPPTKIGHTFDGWYLDMDFNDEYSIENTIESDITLYAYWIPIEYLITFESNGGTSVADQKVEYGKFLNQPIIDKENFELVGWYLDDDFDTPFDFSEPISTDVILYAKWTEKTYTITFNTLGGTSVSSISGTYGIELEDLLIPEKDGHSFIGWFEDEMLSIPFEREFIPSENLVIFAKWETNDYDISFETNGGSIIDDMTLGFGEIINLPSNPVLENAVFDGWYIDNSFETLFDINSMPSENLVLYAKWLMPDEQRVLLDIELLNLPELIQSNINLTTTGQNGTSFSWIISRPDLISKKGEVILSAQGSEPIPVTLTLNAQYLAYEIELDFDLYIGETPDVEITSSTLYNFESLAEEYTVQPGIIELFFEENGSVPYVDIEEFIILLDGAIESVEDLEPTEITDENNEIWHVLKSMSVLAETETTLKVTMNEVYTPMVHEDGTEDSLLIVDVNREVETYSYEAIFDFISNTYYSSNFDFFDSLGAATSTDFGDGLEFGDTIEYPGHDILISFGDYRFDLVTYEQSDGEIEYLMPLHLANLIFIGSVYYDVYFNGDSLYGFDSYQLLDDDQSVIEKLRTSSKNAESIPFDLRISTYDYLALIFDYFYGLKDDKDINLFYDYFVEFRDDLIFGRDTVHYGAIFDLIYSLDDLHTYHNMTGYYVSPDYGFQLTDISQLGPRSATYYLKSWDVDDLIIAADRQNLTITPDGKTAVIVVDQFTVDTPSEFEKQLSIIQTTYPLIENVVIDLTNNGGGNVGAVWRMFGYMTEESFFYHSANPTEGSIDSYEISSTYTAYDYEWYIMISPVTFSAANLMAAMAKEEGIATIIGVQSSGGASSISGTVLPSGDVFFMSSTNVINVQISEGEFESVEYGVVPDYEYPGLSKLYDYEYLQNVINNLKTN